MLEALQMNLAVLILVAIVAYVVYMYIQSYNRMTEELKEIRLKCMSAGTQLLTPPAKEPTTAIANNLTDMLRSLQKTLTSSAA